MHSHFKITTKRNYLLYSIKKEKQIPDGLEDNSEANSLHDKPSFLNITLIKAPNQISFSVFVEANTEQQH
ncbi:hypothetical protein GGU45_001463 [Niabella hirudinis]